MAPRILIVDDSSIIRAHCRVVLRKAGYEVVEAENAEQARARLQGSEIGFMLCDLNLPGTHGLDLIESLRAEPAHAQLPIAVMTAEWNLPIFHRAHRLGVKHWLLKPYKADELVELVARFVGPGANPPPST